MKYLTIFIFFQFSFSLFAQSFIAKDNTYLRQGNQKYSQNTPLEAEKAYRKSIEINPQNTAAQFNLGDALYQQKRYDEAATQFQQVDNETAHYNLGNSLLEQKKYAEAIEAYKQVLRKQPNEEDARYNLAYAQAKLKEEEQEKKDKKQEENSEDKEKDEQKKKQEQQKKEEEKQKEGNKNPEEKQKNEENKPQEQDKKEPGDKPNESSQPQKPSQISQQDAKRIMEVLKNEEEKVRTRVQQQRNQQQMGARAGEKEKISGEKDW